MGHSSYSSIYIEAKSSQTARISFHSFAFSLVILLCCISSFAQSSAIISCLYLQRLGMQDNRHRPSCYLSLSCTQLTQGCNINNNLQLQLQAKYRSEVGHSRISGSLSCTCGRRVHDCHVGATDGRLRQSRTRRRSPHQLITPVMSGYIMSLLKLKFFPKKYNLSKFISPKKVYFCFIFK